MSARLLVDPGGISAEGEMEARPLLESDHPFELTTVSRVTAHLTACTGSEPRSRSAAPAPYPVSEAAREAGYDAPTAPPRCRRSGSPPPFPGGPRRGR